MCRGGGAIKFIEFRLVSHREAKSYTTQGAYSPAALARDFALKDREAYMDFLVSPYQCKDFFVSDLYMLIYFMKTKHSK
jgi:hypothetical protein